MRGLRSVPLLVLPFAAADLYLQSPPGSNNRLDEGGGNRNNNNRLMDTQNNAKGGYGYAGDADNQGAPVVYMSGSKLPVSWTAQHSCGSENAECQIVVQMMCNDGAATPAGGPFGANQAGADPDGEGPLRDGTDNNAPDPNNVNTNRGLHEPTSFYKACQNRERNKGLYTSDQNLNGDDATKTRQNNNGARSGLECPEERDYYPYWAPSPWRDLTVMTNNLALCDYYQTESQNVKPRGYCQSNQNLQPNNEAACAAAGGTWTTTPAFGDPPPTCVSAPVTRDNHLGSAENGYAAIANISVPTANGKTLNTLAEAPDDAQNCALRIRYNITTADTRVCSNKGLTNKADCEAAGETWSAFYLDSTFNDQDLGDTPPLPDGNPQVDATGGNPGGNNAGGDESLLELAVNTNQYGRTFQDRTHTFSVQERPASIAQNVNIFNLNVQGKRGNIVQTYPAVEYDFQPTELVVGQNDLVHIQWTGNDNTNNNGDNNGEGTNNEDRHNIVQLDNSGLDVPVAADQNTMFDVAWEWNADGNGGGARGKAALVKEFALSKQTGCDTNPNNDQQRSNCEKLNAAASTLNMGMLKFKPGKFKYMSSRNNNFSNRAQKGQITVVNSATVLPPPPVNVTVVPIPGVSEENRGIRVSWSPPGDEHPYIGTDGKPYSGFNQKDKVASAYTVQYSIDGGIEWLPSTCQTSELACEIKNLPAGTPVAVRVRAASDGGWSEPSHLGIARTDHSEASLACAQQLVDQVNGNFLSPGATAAIVIGVLAAVLLGACLVWMFFCGGKEFFNGRMAPPPPDK